MSLRSNMASSSKSDTAYTLRLRYLKDAAHVLNANSPSTAAHLLSDHIRILHADSRSLTFSQHREICAACGSIRLPDWPKELRTPSSKNKKRRKGPDTKDRRTAPKTEGQSEETEERFVFREYRCMRCHRSKPIPEMKPAKPVDKGLSSQRQSPTPSANRPQKSSDSGINKSADNASSKKRAKLRKEKGLLAALNAGKSQQSSASSQSFDLFDFMQ